VGVGVGLGAGVTDGGAVGVGVGAIRGRLFDCASAVKLIARKTKNAVPKISAFIRSVFSIIGLIV
jgi:hypothetical protein